MELKEDDYKFLLTKYKNSGIYGKNLEERLKLHDPYINLEMLKLTLTPLYFL